MKTASARMIAGLFGKHTGEKGTERFCTVLESRGFLLLAACMGHRPFCSLHGLKSLFHPFFPFQPFYGWPPFFGFSGGHPEALRKIQQRIREAMEAGVLRGEWQIFGTFPWEGGDMEWILVDTGVFRGLGGFFLSRQKTKNDLRVLEKLFEGMDHVVQKGPAGLFQDVHRTEGHALDCRVGIPCVDEFQNLIEEKDPGKGKEGPKKEFF